MAQAMLVLSHLVPPDDPEVTEQMWIDAAKGHFRGQVIAGRDLLEIRGTAARGMIDVHGTRTLNRDWA